MAQGIKNILPQNTGIIDYSSVTEAPGMLATQEQLARLYNRYRFALEFAEGRDVLEVACGSGVGLALLAESAKKIVGGDVDLKNLSITRRLYANEGIEIKEMDAHHLPFPEASFDLIVLFEAIYYLKDPIVFINEAFRVLRDSGLLIIGTVNCDWKDFHPSPFAVKYYSLPDLREILQVNFKKVDFFGAFPVQKSGFQAWFISTLKRMAVSLDMIPGSLKARSYLKRAFFGPLRPIPDRVYRDMAPYAPPVPINDNAPNSHYKIIYAVAGK